MKKSPKRVSSAESLMKFNMRVLEQGHVNFHKTYSVEELKERLFFNKVYSSNVSEMYDKYPLNEVNNLRFDGDLKQKSNLINIIRILDTEYGMPIHYTPVLQRDVDTVIEYLEDTLNTLNPVKTKEIQNGRKRNPISIIGHDQLIEYPLDSFNDYLSFLQAAADNPDTVSIKICLYRIGSDPAIFDIIQCAVSRDIKVHVNVELKASGEDINYEWAERFRKIGCTVTTYAYGRLKVHCKLTLVKFINGKRVAQIGTGNYHTKTTTQYTDLSLITADDDICRQVNNVFKILKTSDFTPDFKFNSKLLVTRYNARPQLIKLIRSQANESGYICIKCNSLDDDEIINELHRAALKGCTMDLIIRGICTWIPDDTMAGSVKIKSIVWDKLEHSRVYSFGMVNPKMYIGSLDLVTHKLDKRIETLVKINDPAILIQMVNYLNRYITTQIGYVLQPDGSYIKEGE